jgi:hydroxymethylglutaryl-CoA synthase
MHMPGIDRIRFCVPRYALDLDRLAAARGVDPAKYRRGLGQERMAVAPPDEDAVTLAAAAAQACLEGIDRDELSMVLVATESAVDQSKAAAVYVHGLLQLPATCQAVEVKQACCGGALALQMALDRVAREPGRRALVLATDVARYAQGSPAEPTQGAGAAAVLVSAHPELLDVGPLTGVHTADVMDVWRPPGRRLPLVNGKQSVAMYLKALQQCWADYRARGGQPLTAFAGLCCHQPFTRLAYKARARLRRAAGAVNGSALGRLDAGLAYNRVIGNSYTASLFIGLASLLETTDTDLAGDDLLLFAYGSGCTGLLLTATVLPSYSAHLAPDRHRQLLATRRPVDMETYAAFHEHRLSQGGGEHRLPDSTGGPFRLAGVRNHQRLYTATADHPAHATAKARPPAAACAS